MKKFLFTPLLIISFICVSNAQSFSGGIAFTTATPVGNFSDAAGTGYGGVFMAKIGLPILDITGSVEYINFSENEAGNTTFRVSLWSVNAGARMSILPFISAGAEIGNYWIKVTAENAAGELNNTENEVAFTPLIAAQFSMFEVSVRYALIKDASFFAIRAGIYF